MAIGPGTRLGPYDVIAAIGAGGMGEVYRARDTRLGRDVAVKVLPEEFATDRKRRARFETEAKAASALQHPGIVTTHDIGEQDGVPYLVTELIDGRTLRAWMEPGALPVRKVVDLAAQIADALAAAHAAAIIHRDLKPDNIMVTVDGRTKILDFGLAKTPGATAPDEATVAAPNTESGMILGTIGYMSPEQVKAAPTDARSDIFSFGVILYEMLSGRRAFARPTAAEAMTAILREEVEPLGVEISQSLSRVVERCLEKEPRRRFLSAGDLAFAIRNSVSVSSVEAMPAMQEVAAAPAGRKQNWVWPAIAVIATGLAVTAFLRPVPQEPEWRYIPWAMESGGGQRRAAWSPDGKSIAYTLDGDIYVRALDEPVATRLTTGGVVAGPSKPAWSKDGRRIYFARDARTIMSVSMAGGVPEKVMDAPGRFDLSPDGSTVVAAAARGNEIGVLQIGKLGGTEWKSFPGASADWTPNTIQFAPDGKSIAVVAGRGVGSIRGTETELWILPMPGESGKPRRVQPADKDLASINSMSWMPDGKTLVLSASRTNEPLDIFLLDLKTQRMRRLTNGLTDHRVPAVSPDGKRIAVVRAQSGDDLAEVELGTGRMKTLLATSRSESFVQWFRNGTQYAYLTDAGGPSQIWVRNVVDGTARPLFTERGPGGPWQITGFTLSPDSERLAIEVSGAQHYIVVWKIGAGVPVRVDAKDTDHHAARWSSDGGQLAYYRMSRQFCLASSTASGEPKCVASGERPFWPVDWSPNGKWLASVGSGEGNRNLYSPSTAKYGPEIPAFRTGAFSADSSTFYAFHATEDGKQENPVWAIEAADVETGKARRLSTFTLPVRTRVAWVNLHPDGKRAAITLSKEESDIILLEAK